MSPLRFLTRNRILAFAVGLLIFIILIPGCLSLTSNSPPKNNQSDNKIAIATSSNLPNSTSSLGVNLNGISDWSTELPFLDHFKLARKWIPQNDSEWDTGEYDKLSLDDNGWIKSLASNGVKYTRIATLLLREIPGMFPTGRYVVLYEGEGTITYGYEAKKIDAESKPGRDVLNVTGGGDGILLTITATDPKKTGNYIRNIRVVQEKNEKALKAGEIFNPVFLDKIKRFRTLRFMDWIVTNNSPQKDWAERAKVTNYTWANEKGVPLEIMVALANKLKADPWFNIPHLATDDYITKFAQYVKDNLDPDLTAYVEYSNEVWNWMFGQAKYAQEQGQRRWGQDKGDAWIQWYGMRSAQMADLWQSIFGNQAKRVVYVISSQTAWKGLEDAVLNCPLWVAEGNKPCYQHGFKAYAITSYFGAGLDEPKNEKTVRAWMNEPDGGFNKAFQQLRDGSVIPENRDRNAEDFAYHGKVAKDKGLQLVVYEGGQSIVAAKLVGQSNDDPLIKFFSEINRRPEMAEVYTQLLNTWKKNGGTLYNQFLDASRPDKWGNWGVLEYIDQNGSPKYNALMKFIDNNPCWWDGCVKTVSQKKST